MLKTIFSGKSKKDHQYVVGYPQESDAQQYCRFINELSSEKTFILEQGEQFTLDQEKEYLLFLLKEIKDKKRVVLFAFIENRLIGTAFVVRGEKVEQHVGHFTVSISSGCRGEGIGKKLSELIIEEVQKNLDNLQILNLGLFGNNITAYNLYINLGFIDQGRIPGGILHKGQYVDHVWMYRKIA